MGNLILAIITLILLTGSTASAALGGFRPPNNFVADISPDLHKYDLQRIGIISFVNHSVTPDAGMRLAQLFHTELEAHQRFELTPPLHHDEDAELAFTRVGQAALEEEGPGRLRQFVQEWLGRLWPPAAESAEQEAPPGETPARPATAPEPPLDAVLTGIIMRYDDRQGNALLVAHPASVAYEAYLISARDGEILWRARFDETQQPLLDNLLLAGRFFKGGGVWQTNDTLARIGLERVVRTFPGIAVGTSP